MNAEQPRRRSMDKLLELAERATVALERIAGALAGQPIRAVPEAAILADSGLSLRKCAEKHGVGVSVVRTLRAQATTEGQSHDPD